MAQTYRPGIRGPRAGQCGACWAPSVPGSVARDPPAMARRPRIWARVSRPGGRDPLGFIGAPGPIEANPRRAIR